MTIVRSILFILFFITCFIACIKEVQPQLRNVKPFLVVEGSVSTDSVPYEVRLTYSGMIELANSIPDEFIESEAVVTIKDDAGNSTLLSYRGNGYYTSTDSTFVGVEDRSYHVDVKLKDGRNYVSIPEKIPAAVPIDSVTAKFIPDFSLDHPAYFRAYVNSTDPAGEENFYKWEFYSYTRRQTLGVGCGFNCVIFEYCLQKNSENELHIRSDADINGNAILDVGIGNSYIYTYGVQYIDVAQISMTKNAFQFWNIYKEQTTRTGDILDPLPALIRGNIYNVNDANEFALGFFSARNIFRKRLVINPLHISEYLLLVSANSFIHKQSVPCFDHYPNTLRYPPPPAEQVPPPPGWANADTLNVYFSY